MSEPTPMQPMQPTADSYEVAAGGLGWVSEWREGEAAPVVPVAPPAPRASAVPARVATVLALSDLTLAQAQRMDDDELMGIPQMGPASLAYIRGTDPTPGWWSRYLDAVKRWGRNNR